MPAGLTLLGVLLLLGLCVDVTLTLFSPFGRHGGPFHRVQNRALWSVFRGLAWSAGDGAKPKILSLVGPVGVLLTVLFWSGWLIGGFAVLYLPHLESFRMLTPTSSPGWLDALYYSGYVASTLGVGDVVAISAPMRALTIVEAVVGFSLFAVSTTYALTVTREAGFAAALSTEIAAFRRVVAGTAEGEEGGTGVGLAALADRRAEAWATALLRITDGHVQYPLLHYFRPTKEDRSLLSQLGWVVAQLDGRTPSRRFSEPVRRLLAEAVDFYLVSLNHGCVPARFAPLPSGEGSRQELHHRLLRHLAWHPTPSPDADHTA